MTESKLNLNFPFAYGNPPVRAFFRSQPEDFEVNEVFTRPFSGKGEHLCLWVQKRGQNTHWVAKVLSEVFGVDEEAIGYCGLKDRHAVTRQWFSVHLPGVEPSVLNIYLGKDIRILNSCRHRQKIRRGHHDGNKFKIKLRDISGNRDELVKRLEQVSSEGVPNYFGEQRFGKEGKNLEHASILLAEKANSEDIIRPGARATKNRFSKRTNNVEGLYFSAARSYLFNLVLAKRVELGTWGKPMGGEIFPEGPLWGRGRSPACAETALFEQQVLSEFSTWCHGLEHCGLKQERRRLLLMPENFNIEFHGADLTLKFYLPAGTFATSVLRELAFLHPSSRSAVL